MKRDDTLWKAILEDVFDDFLVFFFEKEAEMFDLERGFEFLDKELEQILPSEEQFGYPKFIDKLVKVFTKTGAEQWVLVHVEVQGYDDPDFPSRMFTYFLRIYDKYKKPVACIAIFTESNKNFRPASFNYSFMGTENNFKYKTYKVIDQQESELRESSNPFAIIILTVLLALRKGKIADDELLTLKTELYRNVLQKQIPKNKIRAILRFIQYYVNFEKPEMNVKFENEINLLTDKHTTMGIEQFLAQRFKNEGVQEGKEIERAENNRHFVMTLLTQTDFTHERIANMVRVPVSFVEEVKASLTQSSN